jgi:hypothetical protein
MVTILQQSVRHLIKELGFLGRFSAILSGLNLSIYANNNEGEHSHLNEKFVDLCEFHCFHFPASKIPAVIKSLRQNAV